jgi:transcriptional regulator with XRE-family HTH domain
MLSVIERKTLANKDTKQTVKDCQAKSLRIVNLILMSTFGERLRKAFNDASNAEIARKIGVSEPAVGNYIKGRIPDADRLIEISNLTGCSLHWLLTGEGKWSVIRDHPQDAYIDPDHPSDWKEQPDHPNDAYVDPVHPSDYAEFTGRTKLANAFESRIREIVREELAAVAEHIHEYDVEAAVQKYDNAQTVLAEWYAHDRLDAPPAIGAIAFDGWATYTLEEKINEIRAARGIMDRQRQRRKLYESPRES